MNTTTLSPELQQLRRGRLTGSRVGVLVKDDPAQLMDLYQELTGDPAWSPPDFTKNWRVQHGIKTEELNIRFFEYATSDTVTRRGEFVVHPKHDWAAVTLDGFVESKPAPLECKAVGGNESIREVVLPRYAAQAHWQMDCTGTRQCVFSIIIKGEVPIWEIMHYDDEFGAELWRRAEWFMSCVRSRTPPCSLPAVAAPVKPFKVIDMTGSNSWVFLADDWLDTEQAAKDNAAAAKGLKELVPPDAMQCHGHGVTISRNRAGALTIKHTNSQHNRT